MRIQIMSWLLWMLIHRRIGRLCKDVIATPISVYCQAATSSGCSNYDGSKEGSQVYKGQPGLDGHGTSTLETAVCVNISHFNF